jgi:cytochrome c oxidase subunit 4
MSEHIVPRRIYVLVWVALLLLTLLTTFAATVDLGVLNGPVALTIACLKMTLVILFFMHVKYSTRLTWLIILAAFFWLGILLTLTMNDYLTRHFLNYP